MYFVCKEDGKWTKTDYCRGTMYVDISAARGRSSFVKSGHVSKSEKLGKIKQANITCGLIPELFLLTLAFRFSPCL